MAELDVGPAVNCVPVSLEGDAERRSDLFEDRGGEMAVSVVAFVWAAKRGFESETVLYAVFFIDDNSCAAFFSLCKGEIAVFEGKGTVFLSEEVGEDFFSVSENGVLEAFLLTAEHERVLLS